MGWSCSGSWFWCSDREIEGATEWAIRIAPPLRRRAAGVKVPDMIECGRMASVLSAMGRAPSLSCNPLSVVKAVTVPGRIGTPSVIIARPTIPALPVVARDGRVCGRYNRASDMDLCKCGCGMPVKVGRRFLRGHAARLRPRRVISQPSREGQDWGVGPTRNALLIGPGAGLTGGRVWPRRLGWGPV